MPRRRRSPLLALLLAAAPVNGAAVAAPTDGPAVAAPADGVSPGSPARGPTAGDRVVLVPFENVAGAGAARALVMRAVEAALVARGYQVVSGAPVEAFLQARRIRWLDSLTPAQAVELQATHDAAGVLVGTILAWDPSERDPSVALALRLIGPKGDLLWTGLQGLTAAETEGAFGLGRVATPEALLDRALARLLAPLPRARLDRVTLPRPPGGRGPRVYRAAATPGQEPLRLCLLPLLDLTEGRAAARVVDAALQQRLAERPGLSVVEPAELRAAVVKGRLRAPVQLSPDQLKALGRLVGTSLFLRGAVLAFGRGEADGVPTPELELYLTLVDVETGRTLWSGLHHRTGLDYQGLLRTGAVHDDATLAGRVAAELLEAFTRR